MKKRVHQIDLFRKYPHDVQNQLFAKLLSQGTKTLYGATHHFDKIKSYEDFQKLVPLQDYEGLKPYINRLIDGEQSILWPGETKWFAKSSGTTSDRSKFIPVTKESLENCHYKGGKDLLALYYDNFPNRKLYNGKHLIVGGSAQINPIGDDSYLGDLSAIIVKNLPWWVEIRRTPAKEIALMSDWEPKIEKMAHQTIQEDVYILAGVPSWTLVLAKRILEITGKKNLKEVWPNLELFMHGGVNFEPYRAEFERLIPDEKMNYVETYNASEGFFGIQDKANSNELLLMLDYGIFYEFIPMEHFAGRDSAHTLKLDQVEIGKNYALVITTNGGLWRYILGDTIQFTSTSPYRFRITGRTKSFINVFGEELIVDNAERAITAACKMHHVSVRDYTVSPIFMHDNKQGSHEWFIEFDKEPTDLELFAKTLDTNLRELNSDYDAKRTKDLALVQLTLRAVPTGTFDKWLASKGKLGGQHKVPRLSNDRTIVDQILRILGEKS